MRILVETGSYHLLNHGDVAMLQVAVARLRDLWPEAQVQVITDAPDRLVRYCPDARPVLADGHRHWLKERFLPAPLYRIAPRPVGRRLWRLERRARNAWPALALSGLRWRARLLGKEADRRTGDYLEALLRADLVVASGGGYITDLFKGQAVMVLDTLRIALRLGKPTAMVGQGLGPLQQPALLTRARQVLPRVDLIALREGRAAPRLLDTLGVPPDRVVTTGDDAVEMAYAMRPSWLGEGIGVNLRVASYSEVDADLIQRVRRALQEAASAHRAPMVPIPISSHPWDSDVETLRRLLAGYEPVWNGRGSLDAPEEVIEQVRRCRLVVTGSYHGAVFALAQGIPAIGLAKSTYYLDKFLGLAEQFGAGCQVIRLDDERLGGKLVQAIGEAWRSAEGVRPRLLEAAARQIERGWAAYRHLHEIVARSRAGAVGEAR